MPVFSFFHYSKEHGRTLTETGPLVQVEVSLPAALKKYLSEKGQPIPSPQSGFALVDTGASATAVDQTIFDALGIQQIDTIPTSTPHGASTSPVYPCQLNVSRSKPYRYADGARDWMQFEMDQYRRQGRHHAARKRPSKILPYGL